MKDVKRWTALAAALMLAVLLPFGNVRADQAVPETFEGFSDRELRRAVADWMDDDDFHHPCNIEQAYIGYQAAEAIFSSALEHRRIDLPYEAPYPDNIERMKEMLPESPIRFYPVVEA